MMGGLLCVCDAWAQWSGNNQATEVITESVTFEYATSKVEAVGTAEAIRSVVLFPAVDDRVTDVLFHPGQRVKAGELLVQLDDRRQAVAMRRAEIQLIDAQRTFKRLQNSAKDGAVTQSALDDAETALAIAKVELDSARADLDDRKVLAPFTGVVGLTDVEVGDRITRQTAITTIDQRSTILINFEAPESALPVLLNEPKVTLEPWSNRQETLTASVAEVDSRINETDRTVRARALLENTNDKYRPGMSFRVRLLLKGERYVAIPEAALLWGASGAYIWKSVDGKAVKTPVEVKQRLRGRILVDGDIDAGELLIAEGVQRLREGQAVTSITSQLAGGGSSGMENG